MGAELPVQVGKPVKPMTEGTAGKPINTNNGQTG